MSCSCNRSYPCCSSSSTTIATTDILRGDANVGDAIVWDGNNWVPGIPDLSSVLQPFDELSDLLESDTTNIVFARTRNYEATDGTKKVWIQVDDSDLSDQGTDVRESDDGSKFLRIFSRGA